MTAEEIMDAANSKDSLMREFIIVKSELDVLMIGKTAEDLMRLEKIFIDLEEKMMEFKIQNRKLMLLTLPIQEMYEEINNKVSRVSSKGTSKLNTTI